VDTSGTAFPLTIRVSSSGREGSPDIFLSIDGSWRKNLADRYLPANAFITRMESGMTIVPRILNCGPLITKIQPGFAWKTFHIAQPAHAAQGRTR
jgi:hypothetical protein